MEQWKKSVPVTSKDVAHPSTIHTPPPRHSLGGIIEVVFAVKSVEFGFVVTRITALKRIQYKIWPFSRLPWRCTPNPKFFIKSAHAFE
jgi:hypothetical protein